MQLDHGLWLLDLGFQGRKEIVAAYLFQSDEGSLLIETGPGSTIANLDFALAAAGSSRQALTSVIVTHIHLDHAGAAGILARENPGLKVYVHPFAAPHLIDPSKLIASATRIYGDQMAPLWGEFAAISSDQVIALQDNQQLTFGEHQFRVIFTPGHAWHHVAIWHEKSGVAITGDVGGVLLPGSDYVCPPTPPPDLDWDAWKESLRRLRELQPRRLLLTHYGPIDQPAAHFDRLEQELAAFMATGEAAFDQQLPAEDLTAAVHKRMATGLGAGNTDLLTSLEWATPSYMAAMGLTRCFTKRSREQS